MGKKLRCTSENGAWVKAEPWYTDKEVVISFVEGGDKGYIFLTPTDARKLRKQIKKALEAIRGVVADDAPSALIPKFSIGDKVRVLVDKPEFAGLKEGEIAIVTGDLQEKTKDGNWEINDTWRVHGEYLEPA